VEQLFSSIDDRYSILNAGQDSMIRSYVAKPSRSCIPSHFRHYCDTKVYCTLSKTKMVVMRSGE
jgi:hypothetical protein